jgi:outer membrane biosynthesis protein TonB
LSSLPVILVVSNWFLQSFVSFTIVAMATEVKTDVSAEEVKKDNAAEVPPAEKEKVNGDEEEEEGDETPTKGKGKRKAKTTPKKEPTPKKEKKTTPKKETTPKRKDSGGAAHTMETRTRKKAREAVDLVVGGPQRAEVCNFIAILFVG